MKGYMYILECADGSYYTGSTVDLDKRLAQHQNGEGSNHTRKHLPVKLVYFEEHKTISKAFYREKQIHGWRREKKEALIKNSPESLPFLARNYTEYPREVPSTSSGTPTDTGTLAAPRQARVPSTSSGTPTDLTPNPVTEPAEVTGNRKRKAKKRTTFNVP